MANSIMNKENKSKKDKKSQIVRNQKPSFSTSPSIELKKVTWPNRETLVKSTILILVIIFITTVYISGLDLVFSNALVKLKLLIR